MKIQRKKILLIISILLSFFGSSYAQLAVTPGLSAYQLATILAGPGVSVSNAVYTGDPTASGSFTSTATNLGLGAGILLTTGSATNAIGPNSSTGITTDFGLPGDSILSIYADTTTHDAAILEFDFIPQNDTLTFRYVFGSDEYPEYVCSSFNDVFGFFLSGPGIVSTSNIALIPGTALPVAINTINSGIIGTYGVNGPNCGLNYPNLYIDNTTGTTIEYDGFTTVMIAKAIVIPCQTYHLRLAIADAGDGQYDSGVFFEKGSLSTVPIVYAGADTTRCSGAVVQLGTPATSGWTYSWTPTTGLSNSTIPNPTINLINNTNAPISTNYILTGTMGTCILKDTVVVTSNPIPNSPFAIAGNVCMGEPVQINYSGNANANATYNWLFPGAGSVVGAGQGPYSLTYNFAGGFAIGLTVIENGCTSVYTVHPVTVNPIPTSTFTATNAICVGSPAQINYTGNASSSANYNWNFNSGTVLSGTAGGSYSVTWYSPNTYSVELIVTENGCASPLYNVSVTVNSYPNASIVSPPKVCTGDITSVSFNGTASANATYSWNFGNAQPLVGSGAGPYQLSWSNGGNDSVRVVITQNGCRDTAVNPIIIYQTPVANFTAPATLCAGSDATINFTGNAASSIYNWNFNSGTLVSGTGSGPITVNYSIAGTHAISLILDNNGCRDTLIDSIIINRVPVASFSSPVHLCTTDTALVSFTGTIYNNPTYNWDFGNSQIISGSGAGPYQLMWSTAGKDSIHLIVIDSGCKDTTSKIIAVDLQPVAHFSLPSFACENNAAGIMFNGISNSATNYNWNFDGGNIISGTLYGPYSVDWSTPGIKSVHVAVNNNGCSDTLTRNIDIYATPVVDFSSVNVCFGLPVQFTNLSTAAGSSIYQQTWNFGDSTTISNLQNPTHTYGTDSTYQVKLIAETPQGCIDSIAKIIVVYPQPLVNYVTDTTCVGNATTFINKSSIHTGSITNWNWTMGTGATSPQKNPQYIYPASGVYSSMLIATSNFGCVDSFKNAVRVWDMPHPNFTALPLAGCQPLLVKFKDGSTLSDGNVINYNWDFGDATTDSVINPSHEYLLSGLMNVGLTLTSEHGCVKDTIYNNYINVYPKPTANFWFTPDNPDMLNPTVYFRNDSWNADTYYWTFGDNRMSTLFEPQHDYRAPGTYPVRLIATTNLGCKDTADREVIVGDTYTIYIPNSFTPNGDGRNDEFLCSGYGLVSIDMEVFSRWGSLISSTHGLNVGWDGNNGSSPAPEDTYVYIIKAVDVFENAHTYTGKVTLVR